MPKIVLEVLDAEQSITRPIVYDVLKQMFIETGLPKDTSILYPGDIEKTLQPGSTIRDNGVFNKMPFTQRLMIDVEETYDPERFLSTAVIYPENLFIFRDEKLGVSIKPVYASTEISINVHFRALDKVSAMKWRDAIRQRVSQNRDVFLHTLTYSYLIPAEMPFLLEELHKMREKVAGYGDTFQQYFEEHRNNHISWLTNIAGTQGAWGVSETQGRIVTYFDFEGIPEVGEKSDEGDTWTISFAYKFKYDKPIGCTMFYPLMVHNQLVKYRPKKPVMEVEQYERTWSMSAKLLNKFEKGTSHLGIPQGITIPDFDEFIPSSIPVNTRRVFTALVNIDTQNPTFLLSLRDLGKIKLDPVLLDFLTKEAPFTTLPYQSPIVITLYYSDIIFTAETLRVDADLNIYSTSLLSLREFYHIRLGIVTDLTTISGPAINRMLNNGTATNLILKAIDPTVKLPSVLPNNTILKQDLRAAIVAINNGVYLQGNLQAIQTNTVQTLYITTDRIENAPR